MDRKKETRLFKIYDHDELDPLTFRYNKKESKNGKTYGLNSEMTVEDVKYVIGSNSDWLGRILPAIRLRLYVTDKEGHIEGPLPILDKIGKYLDGNESILTVQIMPSFC